jgi:hypothetical protein
MEFIKKYWYYSVILGLVLYIFTFPKKVYKVIPKETQKYEKVIDLLIDSINNLNFQKNELLLVDIPVTEIETVTVEVQLPPKEKIIYQNEVIIQESDCVDFYSDRKLDSLWTGNRITKKNNSKR